MTVIELAALVFIFTTIPALTSAKFRICVVDGKGGFQHSDNFCPKLLTPESKVECVKGHDRFDCLRKLRKNLADFSIFTPEDLIAASNTENDVLITNELRISQTEPYEEQLVAVVSNASGITSAYDLQDKILCHPGYEANGFISEVLTNFLETIIVRPQSCDVSLTVPENRILSSSKFFKAACKPGPWVNDPDTDRELKRKYGNLCKACSSPTACSKDDKYYGNSGSLLCLKDGRGDISWTTYKQVRLQFDLDNANRDDEWMDYKYLCRDNRVLPLDTTKPCTWVAQPWPVVAANRQTAGEVQKIVSNITHDDNWEGALLDLLEVVSYHVDIHTLDSTESVDTYLPRIPGYLNANSFTGCHPPRTVRVCTTSIPAQYKCGWMREAAAVHGLEPDIDCLKADNATHCMDAIQKSVADIVIVDSDFANVGQTKYNLKTLFYEGVNDDEKYITVPVVKKLSDIKTFEDLKGKRACFPAYDGISWNSIIYELNQRGLISKCPYEKAVSNFFGDSCVPHLPQNYNETLKKLCPSNEFKGDVGALDCLKRGVGDVAFVSENNLRDYIINKNNANFEFRVLCNTNPCHLSWAAPAQGMVSSNITSWRSKDILDVFLEMDHLFGQKFKEVTRMFTMYGEFDGRNDILFNDKTVRLQKTPKLRNYDTMTREYGDVLRSIKPCDERGHSSSNKYVPSQLVLCILCVYYAFRIF